MEKVAVIILNYKVKDPVLKCVESVKKSDYKNLQIIVVDNNSQDGLETAIANQPDITFLQTGENHGYTGGNNRGIEKALKEGADFCFILNPDTQIQKNTLSILVEQYKSLNAGIVGPKIYFSNSNKIWYAGGIFDSANVLGSHRGVDQEDTGQYDEVVETDYITGAAMLISAAVLQKIGLFDEQYFLYYEDSDLSFRAKKAGYKLYYIPQAVVYHENAQSTGLGSPLQDYFITRNRMLFAKKFLSLRTQFALFREAVRNLNYPARRLALQDFLLGRFGKGSYIQ